MTISDGDRYLVAVPSEKLRISYSIDYKHPQLEKLSVQIDFHHQYFKHTISQARTFGFLREVEALRSKGLAQGGSTENVLVFTENSTLNEPRFESEPIYHKVLDLMGDLALIGRPLIGHILCSKGGHALDIAFGKKVKKMFSIEDSNSYQLAV